MEVAHKLLDIFLLYGVLSILQSDNASGFSAVIITELNVVLLGPVMVHAKPRHPQSQGLQAWMSDNNINNWSV